MRRSVLIPMCLLVACSSPTAVRLGDTATLAPGQTARLEGYGIEVTFLAVPEDSRCSPNELILCLWEGDALVALRVSGPDGVAEFGVHTHRDFGSVASYGSFTIGLYRVPWTPCLGVLSEAEVWHGDATAVQSGVQSRGSTAGV